MFSRVIAVVLALVLAWTGVFSHERPGAPTGSAGLVLAAAADPAGSGDGGSIQHHHLDDQPTHQADAGADLPDTVVHSGTGRLPLAGRSGHASVAPSLPQSPDLPTPQRPPRPGPVRA